MIEELKSTEDNKEERQTLVNNLNIAKKYLKEWFGVENITTIEGVYLRRILEQVIWEDESREKARDQKILQRESVSALDMNQIPDIPYEAVARWLMELYDIPPRIYTNNTDQIKVDEKFKEYLRLVREKAHLP